MNFIRLECKSAKQLKRTCRELEALGVPSYLLSSASSSVGVGNGISFYTEGKEYTCGPQAPCEFGDEKYYKRKDFIAAVKRVLGESK